MERIGDRLIAIGHKRVTGEASGAAIDSPFAYVIEFRDGKPRLIQSFSIQAMPSRRPETVAREAGARRSS